MQKSPYISHVEMSGAFDQSFATAVQGDRIAIEMSGAFDQSFATAVQGDRIAIEMSGALTKVLPRLCRGIE